jgi:AAA domain
VKHSRPPPHTADADKFQIEVLDGIDFPHTLTDWLERNLPPPRLILGEWLTTTSKVLVSAPTGLGKTNFVLALAAHAAAGRNFLHWQPHGKFSVVYVDGEMSRRLLTKRLKDAARRVELNPAEVTFYVLSHEDIDRFKPLNTPEGKGFILDFVKKVGGVDLIIFDNVMALTVGDMKDEESWQQTLPLVAELTRQEIGQIWVHHTGHNKERSYGTSTREWRMDTAMLLTEQPRADTDASFSLTFTKARERTPETRRDFEDVTIALLHDQWTYSAAPSKKRKEPSPLGKKFLDALRNAFADAGAEKIKVQAWQAIKIDAWKAECVRLGLIDPEAKPDSARTLLAKYRRELLAANLIACDGALMWPV